MAKGRDDLHARLRADLEARSGDLIGDDDEPAVAVEEPKEVPDSPPPPPEDDIAELRRVLLQGVDPAIAALIDDDKVREINRKAKAKAEVEKMKAALKRVEETAEQRAQVEQGLKDSSVLRTESEQARLSAKVRVRFRLPDEGRGSQRVRINWGQMELEENQWYMMTVAEMESLRETHYRAHLNEIQFSTLDQARRAGLSQSYRTRAEGTTAARILMAREGERMEIEYV